MSPKLLADIRALGIEVSDDLIKRTRYAEDASIFYVQPAAIVTPKTPQEVAKIVRFVAAHTSDSEGSHLSITARAAGTGMDGGALTESLVLDVAPYLTHLGNLKEEEGGIARVTIEPGVPHKALEALASPKGYMLPSFTASKDICTLGGMIANNSSGEYSLAYGATAEYVRSLTVVLNDGSSIETHPLTHEELEAKKALGTREGEIYRGTHELLRNYGELLRKARPHVHKNTSGYALADVVRPDGTFDLTRLFVGSQGTLGIITKAELELVHIPHAQRFLVVTLPKLDVLPALVTALTQEKPLSIEAFDENTFALASEYMKDISKNTICTPANALTVIVRFGGDTSEEVVARAERAQRAVRALHIEQSISITAQEAEHYWKIRRASFQLLRTHAGHNSRVAPFVDDIVVAPEHLPEFLPKLRSILHDYYLTYTIAGHIGEGNFHIIPLVDMRLAAEHHNILECAERVFTLVRSYQGSMTGEHNDGIIRTPFVEYMYGTDVYEVFVKIKQLFDPQNIFNPGKKVHGSIAFALEHFATENKSASY